MIQAAHCTESAKPLQLTVRSGSSQASAGGDLHYVSNIYDHPQYSPNNFDYDFSILKIFGRIIFNTNQKPIKLPDEDDVTAEGVMVKVFGWGNTQNKDESEEYLRGVELITISHEECEEAYKIYDVKTRHNKICAAHPDRTDGKDACQGDSVS